MYTGNADTKKLKDRALLSAVGVIKKVVKSMSSPSQLMIRAATASRRDWALLVLMEMTMLTPTVRATLTAVLVEVRLMLGLGVPPGAERVVEGEGVLLGEGRLVMDSLG